MQLRFAGNEQDLRILGTLNTLQILVRLGHINAIDAAVLDAAWVLASRIRSAQVLALDKGSEELPLERNKLEAIARILEFEPDSATELEELYLAVTRRARVVFQRLFVE
jgi:glutamate-ammonia-ligase adenylyltransferase